MRAQIGRKLVVAVVVGMTGLVSPATAGAATQLGETFGPGYACGNDYTELQSASPGGQYEAHTSGVITSWSFQAPTFPPGALKFKVARPIGGAMFTIVGESFAKTPTANMLNTYTDIQIPVIPGDVIGLITDGAECGRLTSSDYTIHRVFGDGSPGSTATYSASNGLQLNISAILEPDCDGDAVGDETQDPDTSSCTDTTPPETMITKQPKDKTKKKQARFEFTSSEAGSTFLCSFDGDPFTACTSPETEKVGKGKHEFDVVAVDPAGNKDATPAEDSWKVKKKKK